MTEPLGDRIRASRERAQAIGDKAREDAKTYAENLRNNLKDYVDTQITQVRGAAKTYVDNKIARLCADNNLIPPP